jgi:HSP20 family molecular chaperone IbpA
MAENTVQVPESRTAEVTTHETTREEQRYVTPLVDIFETPEGLTVLADLPGVENDQLEIHVEDNILTIKGGVWASNSHSYLAQEFIPTSYFRQFTLGEKIDRERIQGELKNGVLTLKLPFAEKAKPRQITVKVG